jgi:GT2 family glycosyltransferase
MKPTIHIVSFNSGSAIEECLASLRRHAPGAEIIIVDNASDDGSEKVITSLADRSAAGEGSPIQMILNDKNRGFAAAANQAARASTGDPVVFLNPDTEVCAGWLDRMCGALEDPSVGVVGCKVLDKDGHTLQHVGGLVRANGLTEHIGRGEPDRGQYDETRETPYVTGAALGIRRRVWEELGGFDEKYFPAYFEELELCWKARARGYRVIVVPGAVVLHSEGASFKVEGESAGEGGESAAEGREPAADGEAPAFYSAYHRNRIRFVLRNFGAIEMIAGFVPAEIRWLATVRPRRQLRAAAYAYLMGLLDLPNTVLHRLR